MQQEVKVSDQFVYEIKVQTGSRLNSGTSSNVYIKLTGIGKISHAYFFSLKK